MCVLAIGKQGMAKKRRPPTEEKREKHQNRLKTAPRRSFLDQKGVFFFLTTFLPDLCFIWQSHRFQFLGCALPIGFWQLLTNLKNGVLEGTPRKLFQSWKKCDCPYKTYFSKVSMVFPNRDFLWRIQNRLGHVLPPHVLLKELFHYTHAASWEGVVVR